MERAYRDLSFYMRHDNDDHLLATIGRSVLAGPVSLARGWEGNTQVEFPGAVLGRVLEIGRAQLHPKEIKEDACQLPGGDAIAASIPHADSGHLGIIEVGEHPELPAPAR
jgi:hypothetical protein